MNIGRISATAILSLTVASCGVANNLTSDAYSEIKSFSISNEIKGGHVTRVYGAGENAAFALGGVIGVVASTDSQISKADMLQKLLEKNNIDIRKKYYNRFHNHIKNHSLVNGKLTSGKGQAEFKLEIYSFGLYASGPFTSKMEPDVGIRATLFAADGKKVWTNFAYVSALNFKGHEYTLEEYVKDPAKLDRAYDAALEKAVTSLVSKLKLAMLNHSIRPA